MKYRAAISIIAKAIITAAVAIPSAAFSAKGLPASGLKPGKLVFAFEPTHVAGPDKGTNTCPVCKYGETPAVQIWVNGDSPANVSKFADALEKAIAKAGPGNLKAFIVAIKPNGANRDEFAKKAKSLTNEAHTPHVAVTYIDATDSALGDYKISASPSVRNTVMVYSKLRVVASYVNLKSDSTGIAALLKATGKALKAK
jgi:protocatechuate 3,4-dioxygenase, beta subunit